MHEEMFNSLSPNGATNQNYTKIPSNPKTTNSHPPRGEDVGEKMP
jgi:hypothetical protein